MTSVILDGRKNRHKRAVKKWQKIVEYFNTEAELDVVKTAKKFKTSPGYVYWVFHKLRNEPVV